MFAVHVKATPRCEMGPKAAKIISFYRFWTQRLTLKITPTQVQKQCPWARQAMLFPCCGGGRFWEAFSVSSRKATSRCEMGPKAAKSCLFKGSRRNVCRACQSHSEVRNGPQSCKIISFYRFWTWHWRSPQRRSRACQSHSEVRNGPQSCKIICFYRFWTQTFDTEDHPNAGPKRCPWARQAMLFPCCGGGVFGKPFRLAVEVHRKATSRCEMGPKAAKSCLFKGSRRNVCRACQSHSEVRNGPRSYKNHLFLL